MIKIVNMIPQSLSGETNQDSEPNLAVNPANPSQIAASAFTPNPMGGVDAPIYVSTDGGDTWSLNNIVPSAGSLGTSDITSRFAGTSSRLFTSILDGSTAAFEVHRTPDFTNAAPMTQLESRANEDQPYVQAATVMDGSGTGTDRVYIGVNDFNAAGGKTATVEQTLDGGVAAPAFSSIRLEKRSTLGQNGPQIRPAIHPDGTVYAAFYRWITSSGSFGSNTLVITNAEAIVVRDDNWGIGATPFTSLTDTSDGLAGRRVATGLTFPFNQTGVAANGQERWGGDISIAVDPRNSSNVYLAYSTLVSSVYTLRVVRSSDRGVTWSAAPLLSVSNAKNPTIAINSLGKVGLAYQQFTGSGATQKWETHFRDTINDGATWSDTILCSVLSQTPTRTFSPYLGDYMHMMASGKDFCGIFSAANTPDLANFPQGVTYLRNHDFVAKKLFALDGVTQVSPSIDPFFFKITQIDPASNSDFYVRDWTDTAATHDTGLEPSTNPVFYATSDVWNQRSNVAPTFVNDQPQNEDPQNNAANFAFARVSRNDLASAETVRVDFLVAEFGTGSPYVLVASTKVSFGVGDTSKIASVSWALNPTSSTHLCLAAQISTPADPFVAPGLNGNTPGWPTTDLMVINDNNKAQRNMSVHYGLSGFGSSHFVIIRNASKLGRDFILRLSARPEILRGFTKPTVQAEGGNAIPFQSGAIVTLPGMKPGESRWVSFGMNSFNAKVGDSLAVDMLEVVNEKTVNGCRINIVSASAAKALQELLLFNAAVFQRLLLIFKAAGSDEVVSATQKAIKAGKFSSSTYLALMAGIRDPASKAVTQFLSGGKTDRSMDVASTLKLMLKSLDAKDFGNTFVRHVTLLNKLDVAATLSPNGHKAKKIGVRARASPRRRR
jgi:hypothetical protein